MIFIMVVSSSLAQTKLGGEKVRERTYYTLRPKVFCKREKETFERSLEPSGQLGIYLQAKMTKTEASDLVFYLEHKMPYISGVDALSLTIYRGEAQRGDIFWSGTFHNYLAPVQKYRDNSFIEFLQ